MKTIMTMVALALLVPAIPAGAFMAAPQPPVASPHQRVLPLQGGQNFRDLGGYRTTDGRTVKWGLLYRSGSMHFLTDGDYAYLEKLGIRTVCDFRDVNERATEPAVWPVGHAPRVLADDYHMDMGGIGKSAPGHVPTAEEARAALGGVYPKLLTQFNSQYRRMFSELLAGRAPLAFNCTAGKDRTGVAAALLLTALGVPRAAVIEDYTLTNRYFDPGKVVHSDNQASMQWKSLPPGVLKAYMAADPAYIGEVFKVMDAHRGGVAGYLRDELGLTRDTIAQLRRMYTT
jgi:protein-tyrosine phosphatase